jgi:peptidoglycan/LPS O-acetylase OafA/YrhL
VAPSPIPAGAASAASGPRPRHWAQLDGLRAVAVLLVCWHHWMPKRFHLGIHWGSTGVDLFFVLSGFLITGILLACRRPIEAGKQGVLFTAKRFYARRFLRIFPLYYAVLALATVGLSLEPGILVSLWTYTFNLVGAWRGALSGTLVSHFWSLAVEEQFYLLWPWVILLVPRPALAPVVCATLAIGPLSRWLLFRAGAPFDVLRMVTPSCLDLLAAGGLCALLAERAGVAEALRRPLVRSFGLLGAGLLAWGAWIQARGPGPEGASALDVLVVYSRWPFFAWLVLAAARGFAGPLGALLSSRPLAFVGQVSYGVYVFHAFALLLDRVGLAGLPPLARFPAYLAATLAVSWLSWTLFESRLNALKDRFPYEAPEGEGAARRAA